MEIKDKPAFSVLGISPAVLKAVEALGFEEPAPIQAAAIPVIMGGHDMVGQSQTGSGKTAAYSIPAIERVDPASRTVQVLILCPTRELAIQVAEEVRKLTAFTKGIHAVPIYGGASYDRQFYELKKGVQIVIGTPGRILDHIERKTLALDKIRMVVLDEADRMLDMGFRDDIGAILDLTPKERQTVFFSATISYAIRDLIKRYSRDPRTIRIEQKAFTVPTVEQWFYEVPYNRKIEALLRLVDYHGLKLGIVFCNTQRMVDELADTLIAQGFSADRLHGGIPQAQRTRVMNKFKKAEFDFLVATDVAARGIDVDDLEVVVNYDLPYDGEDYVHRIGRTGRAGKRGMAITFVSGRDIYKLSLIERFTRTRIHRGKMPTLDEVEGKKTDARLDKVRTVLNGEAFRAQASLVDRLLEEGFSSTDIAAAVLHVLIGPGQDAVQKPDSRKVPVAARPPQAPKSMVLAPPAAAVPELVIPPPPQHVLARRAARHDTGDEEEDTVPVLRLAPEGSRWVRLSIGWRDNVTPRAIVDLLVAQLGVPAPGVGMIHPTHAQSFAQVRKQYLDKLVHGPVTASTDFGEVRLSLLPEKHAHKPSHTPPETHKHKKKKHRRKDRS